MVWNKGLTKEYDERVAESGRISSIEILLAEELRRRGIRDFNQQAIMLNTYKVDFLVSDFIIIEADGDYWHNLEWVKNKDKKRDAILKNAGFEIFRFWEHEIKSNVSKCIDKVLEKFPNLNI